MKCPFGCSCYTGNVFTEKMRLPKYLDSLTRVSLSPSNIIIVIIVSSSVQQARCGYTQASYNLSRPSEVVGLLYYPN